MSIFGVQWHYFVRAPATLPIDLLEGMGIVAMTEREQKQRGLRQESQRAQHVFGQLDLRRKQKSTSSWRSGTRTLVLSKFLCSASVWPTIYCKRLGLLHRGTDILRSVKREQANRWLRHEGTDPGASYLTRKQAKWRSHHKA